MTSSAPQNLLDLLHPGAGVLIPGAANALAARIIESAGFPIVYLTGAGVANSYLGAPDMGLTTVTEMAAHVAAVRDAVQLPLIADGDTGFGNPLNLVRTDARAVEGFDAALDRMAAYKEAGADLLFVEAPTSRQELQRITQAVPGRHIANVVYGGKTPMLPREDFAALGFAGVLFANAGLQAAMLAMKRTMMHLQTAGSLAGAEDSILGFDERQKFVDPARWLAIEQRYAATGIATE